MANWELLSIPYSSRRYKLKGEINAIELPQDEASAIASLDQLTRSPEDFEKQTIFDIDSLAQLVRQHISKQYAGGEAKHLQAGADLKLNRIREFVHLHSVDIHTQLVLIGNPSHCNAERQHFQR